MSDGDFGEGADEAFSVLADETRLAILQELWWADGPLPFSDLRDRVGATDSGRFNYHLKKLTDHFVERTDDGYELGTAAIRVMGAVFAGTYSESATLEPIPVGFDCYECGGPVEAHYDAGRVSVQCAECDAGYMDFVVPPGILHGRERENLPAVFSRYVRSVARHAATGFCPFCLGPTAPGLGDENVEERGMVGGTYTCQRCDTTIRAMVGTFLLDHPTVVRFYDDHGIDVRNTPLWEFGWLYDGEASWYESEDPPIATIRIELDGDALTLRVDEELRVIDTARAGE
jgi:hypothetical protein